MNSIERLENEITRNRTQTAARRTEIQQDTRFNPDAKRQMLSELDKESQSTHSDLRRQHKEAIAGERDRLRKAAFRKTGSNLADPAQNDLNWRSALEAAGRADTADRLEAVLSRAELTGDKVLRQAALVVAVERNYTDVLEMAAGDDGPLSDYLAFERKHGSAATARQKLHRSMHLSAPAETARAR